MQAFFTGDASLPPLATLSPLMRPSSDAGLKIEAKRDYKGFEMGWG